MRPKYQLGLMRVWFHAIDFEKSRGISDDTHPVIGGRALSRSPEIIVTEELIVSIDINTQPAHRFDYI